METPINFNIEKMSKAVKALVCARAIRYGNLNAYDENGNIVNEDPSTDKKSSFKFFYRILYC